MLKNTLLFTVLVSVSLLFNVYANESLAIEYFWHSDRSKNYNCTMQRRNFHHETRYCACDYMYARPEKFDAEFEKKLADSFKSNSTVIGMLNRLEQNGKVVPFHRIKNYEFSLLHGAFTEDDIAGDVPSRIIDASFYGATLRGSCFSYMDFVNCDFRYANLQDVDFYYCDLTNSNFKEALILGARFSYSATKEQILSTDSFTKKFGKKQVVLEKCKFVGALPLLECRPDFVGVDFNKFNNGEKTPEPCNLRETGFHFANMTNCKFVGGNLEKSQFVRSDLQGSDFSKTDLSNSIFYESNLKSCNLNDANIQGADFVGATLNEGGEVKFNKKHNVKTEIEKKSIQADQLKTTINFKNKELFNVTLGTNMFGINLANFNLTGSRFWGNLTNVDFTDSVISRCEFGLLSNITIEQIKSTWNYKTKNMTGIILPEEIQKELDAEKQKINEIKK
jgi:uncharacterized protein YjbI with pentapeptide repeats